MQSESSGDFLIGEILGAQQQEFRMPPAQCAKHGSYALLPGVGGEQLLRSGRRLARETEKPLEPVAACLPPQFVQGCSHAGSIQPPLGVLAMSPRIPPPFQKNIDRQFLRAGLVVD